MKIIGTTEAGARLVEISTEELIKINAAGIEIREKHNLGRLLK